jgi:hypothetical protein
MPVPDFSPGEVLTADAMDSIGLWKIGSGTLSLSTTPTNVTGVFSSLYTNYRVLLNVSARSTTNRFQWQYLVGTTATATQYFGSGIGSDYAADAVAYYQRSNNDTSFIHEASLGLSSYVLDIYKPNVNVATINTGQVITQTNAIGFSIGGLQSANAQFTGFRLFTNTGTMTVNYQVFGYRN